MESGVDNVEFEFSDRSHIYASPDELSQSSTAPEEHVIYEVCSDYEKPILSGV